MKKISIKEFKEKSNIDLIKKLMRVNNGYITSRLVTELGIHRMYLTIMEERKIIKRVANGIYVANNKEKIDRYYIYSLGNPKVIFSHLTALYLYGIYPYEQEKFDISIPHKYHNIKNNVHNVYYLTEKYYKPGIKEIKTKDGNKVIAYDVSRCICDIIRDKQDEKIIKDCMKNYIIKYNKFNDLMKYAELLHIKDRVLEYYKELEGESKRNLNLIRF